MRVKNIEYLDSWFTYHAPTSPQITTYRDLREAARAFAMVICKSTPDGADQTAALRKVREAVMTANAAIACSPDMIVGG